MKNFFLEELNILNVVDKGKLQKYVDFCLDNSLDKPITFKTNHHHILPKAKSLPWVKYKNLKEYPWNGVHLFHKDHFIAHSLLAEAISDTAIIFAWNRMRIAGDYDSAITPETYQILCENSRQATAKLHRGLKRSDETKTKISNSLTGRKLSEEHIKKMSEILTAKMSDDYKDFLREKSTGRKHTTEEIEKQIRAQTGKTQKNVMCPHCNVIGGNVLMSRWHFDKCKKNPDITQENVDANKITCPHCNKVGGINVMKRWHFDKCKERI